MNTPGSRPDWTPEFRLLLASACYPPGVGEAEALPALCRAILDWPAFLRLAERHGLGPTLYGSLSEHARDLVPPDVLAELRGRFEKNQLRVMNCVLELSRITRLLGETGIACCPLKGPLLSQDLFGDIKWRESGDVDLLILPEALHEAERQLLGSGYARTEPSRPLSAREWRQNMRLFHHSAYIHTVRRVPVELHWAIFEPYLAPPEATRQMAARASQRTYAGFSFQWLRDEDNLIFLLCHGAMHSWIRLKWLVDVVALARRKPALDWGQVEADMRGMRLERALGQGLWLANQLFDLPVPARAQAALAGAPAALGKAALAALLMPPNYASPWGQLVFMGRNLFAQWRLTTGFRSRMLLLEQKLHSKRLAE
jgi:hypothetical protein